MSNIAPLVLGLASADIKSAVRRARVLAAFYFIAVLFGVSGTLALLVSLGLAMSRYLRPEVAALSVAGILIATSLTVLAIASIWSARERNERKSKSAAKAIAAAMALSVLPAVMKNRFGFGLMAAVAGGYILANRKPLKPAENE